MLKVNRSVLVMDGDSISCGIGASPDYTLCRQILPLLKGEISCHVTAVGGRPIRDCLTLFNAVVGPLYNPLATCNIIFFHAGDNDIAQGSNANEAYSAMASYIACAHRQGWLVVTSTELQRYDWPEAIRAVITELNNMIVLNDAGADGIADFQSNPIMGGDLGRLDRVYYTADQVHPADAGYTILAEIAAAALLPHLLRANDVDPHHQGMPSAIESLCIGQFPLSAQVKPGV